MGRKIIDKELLEGGEMNKVSIDEQIEHANDLLGFAKCDLENELLCKTPNSLFAQQAREEISIYKAILESLRSLQRRPMETVPRDQKEKKP